MNIFGSLTGGYLLLAKGLAFIALLVALYAAWNSFTGHYVDIGKDLKQAEWDKQKKVDADARIADLIKVRDTQEAFDKAKHKIDSDLLKDTQDENKSLNSRVAVLNADNRKLRVIRGEAIAGQTNGQDKTSADSDRGCYARLPPEIGQAFRAAREAALRVGSEANELALKLNACNKIVQQDRIACSGE